MYLVAYQQFRNFSFVTYISDRPSLFPSYLKLVLLPYVKPGSRLFPVFFALDHLLIIHEQSQTSTAPSCLNISGKVLSTLITTQQVGIYRKSSLVFAIHGASSPTPIYWYFALCVYGPCANLLALRVLSVKGHVRSYKHTHTARSSW